MSVREDVLACGRAPLAEATALPFAAYVDPDLYALECERIFRRDWIAVCAEAALPDPGDCLALDLAGEPVVVLRGRDGELRALSNACRHRGTPIADPGFGKGLRLVCPYHAWAYDDDGRLRGAPHTGAARIDRAAHGLPRFAVDVWRGIVFVHLGDEPKPLADRLAGIDAHLGGYALERFDAVTGVTGPEVWHANWKAVLENGLESYHIFQLHRHSLEPALPSREHSYLAGGPGWTLTPGRRTQPAPANAWPSTDGFAREHYVVVGLPPGFYSGLTVEGWALVFVHPLGPERTLVSTAVALPEGGAPGFAAGSPFASDAAQHVLPEDRAMCERVQRGMRSRLGAPGRLVELERILHDFHAYLARQLGDD